MSLRSKFCVLVLGLSSLANPASIAADLTLESTGGGTLAKITTFTISGTPGDEYLFLFSLSGGPTPLPPPNQPATLDVGLEFITLCIGLPGFRGILPASGEVSLALPFPNDPILSAITLHFQTLRILNGANINGASNPWVLRPSLPDSTRATVEEMPILRAGHTATPLSDGTVLFIGGGPDGLVASFGQTSIEIYHPNTQTFEVIGQLNQARVSHTATLLDDGKVLVVGGAEDIMGEPTKTAELVDPATGNSTNLPAISVERALHTASLLPDGRVLIAGGTSSFANPQDIVQNSVASTEIYDDVAQTFSPGPAMSEARVGHQATTLDDDRVLITGGFSWNEFPFIGKVPFVTDTAQLYTPNPATTGAFGGNLTMTGDRFGHSAIKLDDGNVLLCGGAQDLISSPFDPIATTSLELFDVGTTSFSVAGTMSVARGAMATARLPNGSIVIAGGAFGALSVPTPDDTVDIYDPPSQSVISAFKMLHVRTNFTATTLPDGTVLLAGGGEEPDPDSPLIPISYGDAEILHP